METEAEQLQRGKWRRRVKHFLVALSAFFCLAAMVAWGFGMAGVGFGDERSFWLKPLSVQGSRGALVITLGWNLDPLHLESPERSGKERIGKTLEKLESRISSSPIEMKFKPITFDDGDVSLSLQHTFTSGIYSPLIVGSGILVPPPPPPSFWVLILPYWLLILLFALAPALWWRRRYVERRQKQFFEQIVAAKRAEQQLKPPRDNS